MNGPKIAATMTTKKTARASTMSILGECKAEVIYLSLSALR
jgi:hypothetical protein